MRLGTYKGIHMTRPNTEVTKHEVLNVLKKKQKEYAVATNIDDRSAQEGDQVILDFQGMYHGQDIPHGNGSDFALTIGAKAFLPEFDDALIGKNIVDLIIELQNVQQAFPCLRTARKQVTVCAAFCEGHHLIAIGLFNDQRIQNSHFQ